MVDKRAFKGGEISLLGLGAMRLPCKTPLKKEANPIIDYKKGKELVDAAYEGGVNYYDTAYMYHAGKSEKFLGAALAKYPRESFMAADKLPIWMCRNEKSVEAVFNRQLTRTGLTYFDNYLMHSLNKENFDKAEKIGAYGFMRRMQAEGKIRNIGFSFHGTIEALHEIVDSHKWDFAQIQLNYLDWKNQNAEEQYNILTRAGIPVIVMEPVRGGKLADPGSEVCELFEKSKPGKTPASWAIGFAASHPNVITVLSGMNSLEQMRDNLNTLTDFVPFNKEELGICALAASILNKKELIPCTGCDYCSDCPQGVKISSIFSAFNSCKSGERTAEEAKKLYAAIDVKADACVSCGACKTHCPQSIEIPELLHGNVGNFFD